MDHNSEAGLKLNGLWSTLMFIISLELPRELWLCMKFNKPVACPRGQTAHLLTSTGGGPTTSQTLFSALEHSCEQGSVFDIRSLTLQWQTSATSPRELQRKQNRVWHRITVSTAAWVSNKGLTEETFQHKPWSPRSFVWETSYSYKRGTSLVKLLASVLCHR